MLCIAVFKSSAVALLYFQLIVVCMAFLKLIYSNFHKYAPKCTFMTDTWVQSMLQNDKQSYYCNHLELLTFYILDYRDSNNEGKSTTRVVLSVISNCSITFDFHHMDSIQFSFLKTDYINIISMENIRQLVHFSLGHIQIYIIFYNNFQKKM